MQGTQNDNCLYGNDWDTKYKGLIQNCWEGRIVEIASRSMIFTLKFSSLLPSIFLRYSRTYSLLSYLWSVSGPLNQLVDIY